MHSPTAALIWDIWARHRRSVCVIVALTGVSWLVDLTGLVLPDDDGGAPPLQQLMGMCSFLLLFGVFNSTESSGENGVGCFPPRLFTLPVSSLRLVAVPVATGTISMVVLYLLWMERLSQGGSTSDLFIALLLASLMVFYQAGLCIFVRLGPLRLIALGTIAFAIFVIGLLPTFPPSPPSLWRSETALSGMVASLALVVFLTAWRQVANLRSGGRGELKLSSMVATMTDAMPRRRQAFASAVSAQFWFEWRCSGMALPILVAGLLLMVITPASWVTQGDPDGTLRLVFWTLAMPIAVAVPVGMAFSRSQMWSDDLSLPSFVAVRPLTAEELVATKVKVAALSAAISWLVVLAFLGVWLSSWANLDGVSRAASRVQAFYHSRFGVYGIAALILCCGLILTWRFLVSRLWSGQAGNRLLFTASGVSIALPAIAVAVIDVGGFVRWIFADAGRVTTVIWLATIVVAAKYSFAAYTWRTITPRHTRQYLVVWLAGTTFLVTLAWLLLDIARLSVPLDVSRFRSLTILLALLAVPLWRIGLAPSFLARNRHR
jgi:hypothetical protein